MKTLRAFNPLVLSILALVAVACGGGRSQARPQARDEGATAAAMRMSWLGGPTAVLERGGMRVITDPMLGPRGPRAFVLPKHPSSGALDAPIARYTALPPVELAGLHAVLISHTHSDHVDARAKELLPKTLPVVLPPAGANALRTAGFSDVRSLDWGESMTLESGRTKLVINAVPAHHAHDATLDRDLGRGNGYVLEWHDGSGVYRVYWTGDAVLSDEMKELLPRFGMIDLLLPHMGGVGEDGALGLRTMNAEEALSLVHQCDPRLVIPIHHTTFGHYREPIVALQQRAHETGDAARVRILAEGETAILPRSH